METQGEAGLQGDFAFLAWLGALTGASCAAIFVAARVEPFFVQTLIGVPLLQGVPPFWARCHRDDFPWGGPDLNWRQLMAKDLDDAAICGIARRKKIRKVLVLGNLNIAERNRLLNCA
jgi:hypothetical protein